MFFGPKFNRFLIGLAIAALMAVFLFTPAFPSGLLAQSGSNTIAALQAQLAALQAQLAALLAQLAGTVPTNLSLPPANRFYNSDMTIGSKGSEVVDFQKWLISANLMYLPAGTQLGYYGPITRNAVITWQKLVGISPANGFFGPISRATLNATLSQPGGSIPPPSTPPPPNQPPPTQPPPNQPPPAGGQATAESFSVNVYKNQSLDKYADRSIAWFTIGGSTTYEPYRKTWNENVPLPNSYWQDFQAPKVQGVLNRGYERIFLHNPFGHTPLTEFPSGCIEQGMQFDQYLEAKRDTPWLVNGFVSMWKPIVASGVEVIAYVGSPDSDPAVGTNGDCSQFELQSNPSAWFARAYQAIQPFLDSGMSIGFDAAVATEANSYTYQFAEQLRSKGVRVYVEAIPNLSKAHWAKYPFLIDNDLWWFHTQSWAVPLSQLKGEIFRFVKYPAQGSGAIAQILQEGYTAQVNEQLPIKQAVINFSDPKVTFKLKANSAQSPNIGYSIKSNPSGGLLSQVTQAGTYIYTANPGFSGVDSFKYTVNDGVSESAQATVTINVYAEKPYVSGKQMMQAARSAGGGSANVVAIWPLFEKEIQNLNILSKIPSNMIPKRVITFTGPSSYIAGYNKDTLSPMAVSAGGVLIAGAGGGESSGGTQFAAAAESIDEVKTSSWWGRFWAVFFAPFIKLWDIVFGR